MICNTRNWSQDFKNVLLYITGKAAKIEATTFNCMTWINSTISAVPANIKELQGILIILKRRKLRLLIILVGSVDCSNHRK